MAQRWLGGPTLTNVFGDRNNANTSGGRLPGLLAIRLHHRPGNAVTNATTASGISQQQIIFGSTTSQSNRAQRLSWYGKQITGTSAAFADRFVWNGTFANGVFFGDIDPATGAGGSSSSARALRTAAIDQHRFEPVMVFLRMNASGRLQMYHAFADGALVAGDFFDHDSTAGTANSNAASSFGRGGGGTAFNQSWSGSMRDFIQVNNYDVSDAELTQLAQGADPATLFGGSLHAHYRMGGPSDLTLTAGSSGYASLTANDTDSQLRSGAALIPALASGRGIQLLPEFDGFVHALNPAQVRGAANRAAVKALTAPCLMRVRIVGSGTTHIWGRLLRASDLTVLVDWARLTPSPVGAGDHELAEIAAPVGVDFIREVGAEDALCVSRDSHRHRAGIVAALIGQSQQQFLFSNPATGADTASANGDVSLLVNFGSWGTGGPDCAVAGVRLDRAGMVGSALYELAKHWQAHCDGIPLMLVSMARAGTAREEWMNNSLVQHWGDSSNPASGHVPATVMAARRRFTLFLENWHTSDQSVINSGTLPAVNDELYQGIGHSGSRRNFAQFPLANQPWIVGIPFTRHRGASGTPSEATRNSFETARIALASYYGGTGGDPDILRDVGAYMTALAIGPIAEGPHQRTDDVRGNVYFARWTGMALARAAKLYAADIEGTFTAASRAANVITLTPDLPGGGNLQTLTDDLTPVGFEVSEDGGTTWSRSGGAIAFTVARVSNTVTLTRGSGNWAAGTLVRYLFGYPWDIPPGNDATNFGLETTDVDRMLGEVNANAPLGKVPLRPTFGALVAS